MIYKNEFIDNEDGISCQVLDLESLNFDNCPLGIKSKITKVKNAKGGEKILTITNGGCEGSYTANKGDAIFCNSESDIYVPHNNDGNAWKFCEITKHNYEIVKSEKDCVYVRSNNKALLMVECIEKPTCIKDAWGKGSHQFLFNGATLKKDLNSGAISGIDKKAFEETWIIFNEIEDVKE